MQTESRPDLDVAWVLGYESLAPWVLLPSPIKFWNELSLSTYLYEKPSMTQSYKSLKEDFVSNLSGGSVVEICLVTAVAPVRCNSDICIVSQS